MTKISNQEFLAVLAQACPAESWMWTCFGPGDPNSDKFAWFGNKRAPDGGSVPGNLDLKPASEHNTYYSVSSFSAVSGNELKRKKLNFNRMLVLVVDDVDLETLKARPSYVLRTSPGKVQAGIFLSAQDEDCSDVDLCSALVTEMTERGLVGDKYGNSVTRYVRLPVGQNQKPREGGHFKHELVEWSPEIRMTLNEAAAAVGIGLDLVRFGIESVRALSTEQRVSNYEAARELGTVRGQAETIGDLISNVVHGSNLHDSTRDIAASLVATGMAPGACVTTLRALMNSSSAERDERWKSRYHDISRLVKSAHEKFAPEGAPVKTQVPQAGEEKTAEIFVDLDYLLNNLKPTSWVVEDMLESEATSVIYGASNVGKSFISIDLACCVATGTPWHGKAVAKGVVVYVAGEGANGIAQRIKAWEKRSGVKVSGETFKLTNAPINLLDKDSAMAAVEAVEKALPPGVTPALVVVDTFARSFQGGDENSSQDVGEFVNNVDRLIKSRWKTQALVVHHSGKDSSKGGRGSGALRAAIDHEFSIEAAGFGFLSMSCKKARNSKKPPDMCFKFHEVIVGSGVNNLGKSVEITSAALELIEKKKPDQCNERETGALDRRRTGVALAEVVLQHGWLGMDWLSAHFGAGKGTISRMIAEAKKEQLIRSESICGRKSYVSTELGDAHDVL